MTNKQVAKIVSNRSGRNVHLGLRIPLSYRWSSSPETFYLFTGRVRVVLRAFTHVGSFTFSDHLLYKTYKHLKLKLKTK